MAQFQSPTLRKGGKGGKHLSKLGWNSHCVYNLNLTKHVLAQEVLIQPYQSAFFQGFHANSHTVLKHQRALFIHCYQEGADPGRRKQY